MVDKHIVKMVLETAQILSTVSDRYGMEAPYRASHRNHPSVRWAGDSLEQWWWLVRHGQALGDEFLARFKKNHKSVEIINWCATQGGRPDSKGFVQPPTCMPETYKTHDAVESYRRYYMGDKSRFASWRPPATIPNWFQCPSICCSACQTTFPALNDLILDAGNNPAWICSRCQEN